jgi:chaperonin cofactor prefoldin
MDLVSADESPRRPSLARDRPSRPPLPNGPRMRSRQKNPLDTNTPPGSSIESGSPVGSVMTSPIFTSPFLRPGSPGLLDESNSFSLDASVPQRVPPYGTSSHARTTSDVGVQASPDLSSPPAAGSPPPPAEKPKLTLKPKPSIATFLAPPSLVPPPAVSFESAPIPWKGLPYEAAQWTFTSSELQEIVSRAIRLSAKESFIRLLSLQALDTDVVKEAERLEEERSAAQTKWRFETNRRTMLMQALNASASILASSGDGDKDNVLGSLISQAAASIASCDSIFASVLQMSDQQSQISIVQHRHWASALGIALRKLNKAVERQGEEMKHALMRIQTLEDELEEAWREAEGMAAEIDEMESDGEEVDDIDDNETLGGLTINTDLGQVMGVTSKAVLSKATLITQVHHIASDAKSVKSVKSSRSRRSNKDGPSRASRLSAAKTRSRTASNASLRLPKALRTPTSSQTSPEEPPPMPALPDNLQCYSFLDMENSGTEYARPPRKQLPDRAHPYSFYYCPLTFKLFNSRHSGANSLPSRPSAYGRPSSHHDSFHLDRHRLRGRPPQRRRSLALYADLPHSSTRAEK